MRKNLRVQGNALSVASFSQREWLSRSPASDGEAQMRWAVILSGIGAAAMLALGFNMILPLGGAADTLCDLADVASAIVFLGLAEGA
jgi:hypothetical protein